MTDFVLIGPQRTDRPAFTFRTRLEGVFYGFRMVWNSRSHLWMLDTRRDDGTDIVSGLACVPDLDLWAPFSSIELPTGQLFVRDSSGLRQDPPRNAWRNGWDLVYRDAAGVTAAAGTDSEVR